MKNKYRFILAFGVFLLQVLGFFIDVGDSSYNIAIAPILGAALVGAGANLVGGAVNNIVNRSNMGYQVDKAKELMQYQWDKFQSYPAQVESMTKAGLNPAALLGQGGSGLASGPSVNMPTSYPVDMGIGTASLTDLANYMLAKANAKKAGAETHNLDIDAQAKQFELELNKYFSAPERIASLTLSWKNVMLKNDEHNINEWKKESEKALSQLKGIERDSAQKLLDNMDIQIEQENKQRAEGIKLTQEKQKTEKSAQSSNYASAEASKATAKNQLSQAEVNKENRRIQAALADFEETAKPYKITSYIKELKAKNAISESDYNEAILKLDRLQDVIETRNTSAIYSGVDSFCEWLKGKVSIFGAIK